MTTRVCDFPGCGRPHRAKGLCAGHLQQHSKGRDLTPLLIPIGLVISEIEWIGTTDTPASIADRLGTTPRTLGRRLRRHGRPDLAARFDSGKKVA